MSEDYTQAEMVRTLTRIEEGQTKLEHKIDALSATYVQKDAYEIRTSAIERDIKSMKQTHSDDIAALSKTHAEDIAAIRTEQAPVKTSPWVIAGFATSTLVGVGSLIGVAITLIKVVAQLP